MKLQFQALVLTVVLGGMVAVFTSELAEARPGGINRSGPASSGAVNRSYSHRGGSRHNNAHNRHDNRREVADNRHDNRREVADNRHEVRHDVRKERYEYHEDRVRRYRGRRLTAAAFRSLNCRSTVVVVNGISYHSCGGTYYEPVYQGTTVVYVVSTPPGY